MTQETQKKKKTYNTFRFHQNRSATQENFRNIITLNLVTQINQQLVHNFNHDKLKLQNDETHKFKQPKIFKL